MFIHFGVINHANILAKSRSARGTITHLCVVAVEIRLGRQRREHPHARRTLAIGDGRLLIGRCRRIVIRHVQIVVAHAQASLVMVMVVLVLMMMARRWSGGRRRRGGARR